MMEMHFDEKREHELMEKFRKTGMLTREESDELISLGVIVEDLNLGEDGNWYTTKAFMKKFKTMP